VAPVKKKNGPNVVGFIIYLIAEREPASERLYFFNKNGTIENVQDMHQFNNVPGVESGAMNPFY
jgi:hypothetical protein